MILVLLRYKYSKCTIKEFSTFALALFVSVYWFDSLSHIKLCIFPILINLGNTAIETRLVEIHPTH